MIGAGLVRNFAGQINSITAAVLAVFLGAFALVYLVGYFNLETAADRNLFAKGLVKFGIHFALVVAAVAHLSRRSQSFYWRTLGWFVAGIAVNAAYGLLQLAAATVAVAALVTFSLVPSWSV